MLLCPSVRTQEEQHSLKKDLASLAISMNMEAQKKRHMMAENSSHVKRATAKEILVSEVPLYRLLLCLCVKV